MNSSFYKRLFSFFLIISLFTFGCTKIVTTDIGGELIPAVDGVTTKEMYLDVITKNAADSATRVSTGATHALGYTNDPLFGKTTASIYMQLKPYFPFRFPVSPDSLMLDSVVLVLKYTGSYGDSNQLLSLKVFEIPKDGPGEFLRADSSYPTNSFIPAGNEITYNYGSKGVNLKLLNDTTPLRIRLDNSFGSKLMDTLKAYNTDSLFNLDFFNKGLQIIPDAVGNGLAKINLVDTTTKLAIYYRFKSRDSVGKVDTAMQYFSCNQQTCATVNYIKRDRTGSQAASYLASADTNQNLIFIDASPGISATVKIPGLAHDSLKNMVIHRAELVMEQVSDPGFPYENYFLPPNLFLSAYATDSMWRFLIPYDVTYTTAASTYWVANNQRLFGCYPFQKKDSATGSIIYAYSFNISRYVQGIITRSEKPYDLVLFAPFNEFVSLTATNKFPVFTGTTTSALNAPAMGRVRLGGGNAEQHRMRLHIVYSEVPQ